MRDEPKTKDRVVIIGDPISGFRVHGMFADNSEAHAYLDRHRKRLTLSEHSTWVDSAIMIKVVNLDSMSIEMYESKISHPWADLRESTD